MEGVEAVVARVRALGLQDQRRLLVMVLADAPPDTQQALLTPALAASSSYVRWRLVHYLQKDEERPDLLSLLPPELQALVLSYVDGSSLLQALQVSHEWNRLVRGQTRVWLRKCREVGVNLQCVPAQCSWYQAFLSVHRQQTALKHGTAFTQRFIHLQNCQKAVKAVDYQDGFLCTVTEEDYVNVWQMELNLPVLTFPVERAVSCIKFQPGHLLVCGHFVGTLTTWDMTSMAHPAATQPDLPHHSLLRCKFELHAGPVFSCDLSEKLDLLVSGGADQWIRLWVLSSGKLMRCLPNPDHWVLRLVLIPDLTHQTCHQVIYMTRDNMSRVSWPSQPGGGLGRVEEASTVTYLHLNQNNTNFISPGLQCSAKLVGLIRQDLDEKEASLHLYRLQDLSLERAINLPFKVKKLLALGERYALLLTVGSVLFSSTLVVLDVVTGTTAGTHLVPHSKMTTPDGAQLVVGETAWLDGLGGHALHPPALPRPCPGPTGHRASPERSAETALVWGKDKAAANTFAGPHTQPALLSAAKEETPDHCLLMEDDTVAKQDRQEVEERPALKLERPGCLILAAGVQSEPGRLFTLWWPASQPSHKCKEE